MGTGKQYNSEYKVQEVKLAREIGQAQAAWELGIPKNTLYGWTPGRCSWDRWICGQSEPWGSINAEPGSDSARKQVRAQEKEIQRLKELNEFLEEAIAFSLSAIGMQKETDM